MCLRGPPPPVPVLSHPLVTFSKVFIVLKPVFLSSWIWPLAVRSFPVFTGAIVCYTTLAVWPPGCPLGNWACHLGTCFAQASARGIRNASKEAFTLLILAVLLFWKTTEQWEGGKFHSLGASLLSSGNNSNVVHLEGNCLNQILSCMAWNKVCFFLKKETKTSTKKNLSTKFRPTQTHFSLLFSPHINE